ncbi:hypothetical protein Pst134EB_003521 [Puccinia striiformis f. sp. tritici]|nr:hypothetical protein Pst134EB_003521 [Puccinia striiformis f. sp. tritici]
MVGLGSNITAGFAGGRNFRDQTSSTTTNQTDIGSATIQTNATTSQNPPSSATNSIINTAQNSHSSASYNSTTTSPATLNHNNANLNHTCDNDPDSLHTAMSAHVNGVADNPKHKYSDAEMEQYATMKLTSLCAAGNSLAISQRMTKEMKQDLDDLYYNQQCNVVRLAIRNRVAPHLFFSHLGITRRMRGDTSWNNFQHEDPKAQRLRAEFDKHEGGARVSLAWASKSDAEKSRYCDRDYLQTLRQGSSDSPHVSAPADNLNANMLYEKRWQPIVQADLDSMAFHNQVEGFHVLASRHPGCTIYHKGGSSFGTGFMDMAAETTETDFAREFCMWVAAQGIQLSKGCEVSMPRKSRIKLSGDACDQFNVGTKGQNITAIRLTLRDMISIATGKKLSCGWPGENTKTRLRELKLSLEVDSNEWSVGPKDFMQPFDYLKDGVDRAVLACLGLNKVHLTHHAKWEDVPTTRKKSTDRDPDNSANTQEEQGPDATGPHERNAALTGHNSLNTNSNEEARAHHDNNHRPVKRARVGVAAKRKHVRKEHPAKSKKKQSANPKSTPHSTSTSEVNELSVEPSVDPNVQAPSSGEGGSANVTRRGEQSTAVNGASPLGTELLDPMLDLLR